MWSSILAIPPLVGWSLTQVNALRHQLMPGGSQSPQMLVGLVVGLVAIVLVANAVAYSRANASAQRKLDEEDREDSPLFTPRFQQLRRCADIAQELRETSFCVEELLRDPWVSRRDLQGIERRSYGIWQTKTEIAIRRLKRLQERASELEQVPVEIAKLLL